MLVRGRAASFAFVVLAAIVSGGSCSSSEDGTPIPAGRGAQQPEGGGAELDEATTCERLRDAEESARKRLNCEPLERAACPFYVRPGGTGCWTYDEVALETCEAALDAYALCSDFQKMPCVLTAEATDPASCPPLPGGEGGQGGTSGDSGGAGGSGAAGESGNAGAGG